jgi:hypothetical protein
MVGSAPPRKETSMWRHRLRRPSPALVVACVALLVALGGTGYATGLTVPRNSVGAPHLKRNAVTSAKLAPNAVQTAHVRDGTLLAEDFKPGQLPRGPKGDKGDKGDRGDTGPPGPTWGDVKGFGTSGGTWTPIGQAVTLPTDVGRRGNELTFLVFGRLSVDLRCATTGSCGMSYVLLVNDAIVPTTAISFAAPAGQTTRNQHGSVFGIVTLRSTGPAVTPGRETKLTFGYRRGNNVVESSTAATVGAVRLGS